MYRNPERARCILITGPGHSATRLLVQMLARHPQVSVPTDGLNGVGEFEPLSQSFRAMLDRMSLADSSYPIDQRELDLILDAYRRRCDPGRPFFLLKKPFFPLICLPQLLDLLGDNTVLLYNRRPADKIVRSFVARGEHEALRRDQSGMLLRKAKRLDPAARLDWLVSLDPVEYFERYVQRCDGLFRSWNSAHPEHPLHEVDVERLAASEAYLRNLLAAIGLDPAPAAAMRTVIDQPRLAQGRSHRWLASLRRRLRQLAAKVVRA
ncbi:MAG: hypothetical protein N838_20405 [Thiohalocapsa sp. PB-PSB1]|jgi:hypothetical protein|nr:MAG: hypothetical protein N838_04255 [Thiohalocapsa sp. PB-PSB1]QQO55356.1 MAG: hypothetical protein N838_20405 [Thiohalocapsa sp. PB-PSB1]HCS90693.1 hypothetical protein [Chromatiaceae bacterium]